MCVSLAVWCSAWCRSVVTKEIVNVEVAPFKNYSILNVTGGYSYHMNEVGCDVCVDMHVGPMSCSICV